MYLIILYEWFLDYIFSILTGLIVLTGQTRRFPAFFLQIFVKNKKSCTITKYNCYYTTH